MMKMKRRGNEYKDIEAVAYFPDPRTGDANRVSEHFKTKKKSLFFKNPFGTMREWNVYIRLRCAMNIFNGGDGTHNTCFEATLKTR